MTRARLIVVAVLLAGTVVAASAKEGPARNVALARQAWAALQALDMERLSTFYADDALIEDLGYGPTGRTLRGHKEILMWLNEVRDTWPDAKFPILAIAADRDAVVVTWRWTGTPNSSTLGHSPVDFRGVTIWYFKAGKIQRELSVYNFSTIVEQANAGAGNAKAEKEHQ